MSLAFGIFGLACAYLVVGCFTALIGYHLFPIGYDEGENANLLGMTAIFWWGAWICWGIYGLGILISLYIRRNHVQP